MFTPDFHRKHCVSKVIDTKFFVCPKSFITEKTWEILRVVNETINSEGDIVLLPYKGCLIDQPDWWREAVRLVKNERLKYRKENRAKPRP